MNIQSNLQREEKARLVSWFGMPIAGTLAALLGAYVLHSLVPFLTLPERFVRMPESPSVELMAEYRIAYGNMTIGNAVNAFALIGACIGLPLGFLFAARSRIASALLATILAGIGGAIGGAAGGYVVANAAFVEGRAALPIYNLDPMLQFVLVQFLGWGAIGIFLGIAMTFCQKNLGILRGTAWGLFGGLLAAIAHAVISSLAFPSSEMMQAVPSSVNERLLWAGAAGLCLALSMIPLIRGGRLAMEESAPRS